VTVQLQSRKPMAGVPAADRRRRRRSSGLFRAGGMFLVLVAYAAPVLLVVSNSFKSDQEILDDPLGLPSSLTLKNYTEAAGTMSYLGSFWNTLVLTVCSVAVICIFGSMTAYFLTRVRWRFNQIVFYLMVAAMLLPFQVLMIPMIKMLGSTGMLQQSWSIVYIYFATGVPLAVFMYAGFIRSIPRELDEAAMLDGCNRFQTFFQVVLPLLRPVTLTIAILDVLWIWNDFLMPFLVLRRPEQRTLTLSTLAFVQSHTTDYGPMMAALVLTVLPVLVAYLFMQRHIVEGLTKGAVK
jgi:raffinose/stachyose/melibiose transport system permease protein